MPAPPASPHRAWQLLGAASLGLSAWLAPTWALAQSPDDCPRLLAPAPAAVASAPARGAPVAAAQLEALLNCVQTTYRQPKQAWPAPQVDAGVAWQELGPRPALPAQPPALVALGQRLFMDPRLSRERDLSCASCHAPHLGFADGRKLALGHLGQAGTRHTPHLMGVAWVPQLMWDGRAADLETQALLPIANPLEMAMDLPALLQRLATETEYPQQFQEAFGSREISLARLGQALAAFQRRIEAPHSRFDDFMAGQTQALNERELHGLHLFRTKARCMNCHSGPQLTQHGFHQIGVSFLGRRQQDLGRQAITQNNADLGAMRTPSLRGVARTAPYFHQGTAATLRAALEVYNGGGNRPPANAQGLQATPPSPLIKPLGLSARELQDLEAFLRTL